jgi:hypothetical protein
MNAGTWCWGKNTIKEEFLCTMYNLLNMHSGNVVTYRYMNSRRKVLDMSCDSVRILHAINTATGLQGRFTERDFGGEKKYSYVREVLPYFRNFCACFVNKK